MSALKKGIKKIGRFLKKHAKKILIAAAIVFTAGIAASGTGAFSLASAAAGGGIKGTLVAIGSTLKTGVVAIGGTLGVGGGVTAKTSLLAANSAVIGANSAAGIGTTLLNGAGAQALGFGKAAAGAAQSGSTIAGGVGSGTATEAATGIALPSYGAPATSTAGWAGSPYAAGVSATEAATGVALPSYGVGSSVAAPAAQQAASTAAGGAAAKAGTGGFMNSAVGSAIVSGGLNAMSSYMAAKAQEDDEAINALYGVSPRDGDTSLTPDQVRFATAPETKNSWRPRLMYDA